MTTAVKALTCALLLFAFDLILAIKLSGYTLKEGIIKFFCKEKT